MKKILIITILLSAIFVSCEKELDFPFEYKEPKLVLNCVLSTNEEIYFTVSRSMHILDTKDIVMISDADIIVYEDDRPLQAIPEPIGDGEFHVAYTPKVGHTYKFVISKDKFKTIEAETTMLAPPTINSLEGHIAADKYGFPGDDKDISLSFTDKSNEENFYLVKVDEIYPDEISEMLDIYYAYDKSYIALSTSDNTVSSSYSSILFFSDELIDGCNYNLKFVASNYLDTEIFYIIDGIRRGYYYVDSIAADSTAYDEYYEQYELKIAVRFSSISKDYYQYLSSLDKYDENDGNPFAEPTLIKTNIKNGLGIFGACSETVDTLSVIVKNPYLDIEEKIR